MTEETPKSRKRNHSRATMINLGIQIVAVAALAIGLVVAVSIAITAIAGSPANIAQAQVATTFAVVLVFGLIICGSIVRSRTRDLGRLDAVRARDETAEVVQAFWTSRLMPPLQPEASVDSRPLTSSTMPLTIAATDSGLAFTTGRPGAIVELGTVPWTSIAAIQATMVHAKVGPKSIPGILVRQSARPNRAFSRELTFYACNEVGTTVQSPAFVDDVVSRLNARRLRSQS